MAGLDFQAACPSVREMKIILAFSASRAPFPGRQPGFKWMQQTFMAIPVARSKREVIEIPFGKDEALMSSKLDQVGVDGEPHKTIGPVFIPNVVRSGDELAKRQSFFPAIRFHSRKYRPGDHAPAIRCFTHAGCGEFSTGIAGQ